MLKRSLCQNLKFSGPKCTHNTGHMHCPATAQSGQIDQSGFKNSYLEFYNSEWGVFYVYGKLRHRATIVKEGLLPSSLIFKPRIAVQVSPRNLPASRNLAARKWKFAWKWFWYGLWVLRGTWIMYVGIWLYLHENIEIWWWMWKAMNACMHAKAMNVHEKHEMNMSILNLYSYE